jgi:ATP-dependent DNA helicase RecQ
MALRASLALGTSGVRERRTAPASDSEPDPELFGRLRALRRRLADEAGMPAYIVFNDRTLREMAARRPDSAAALLAIPGVGQAKLERWGKAFLRELQR